MKNKKDLNINISLGALSNLSSKLYLNNRSTQNLESSNKGGKNNQRSKSKNSKTKQRNQGSFWDEKGLMAEGKYSGYHLRQRKERDRSERQNKDNNTVVSRQNSESKRSRNDDLSVKNRQQATSYRKLHLAQNKTFRNQQRSTNVSILYEQRPHQSENLRHADQRLPVETHRKLYTFCNQNRNIEGPKGTPYKYESSNNKSKSNIKQKQKEEPSPVDSSMKYEYNSTNPTIMVKEEELKRFTHKFAREKIEFQELINGYREEIKDLDLINKSLVLEKNDLVQCLQHKDEQLQSARDQLRDLEKKIDLNNALFEQEKAQTQKAIELKDHQIKALQNILTEKENRIEELFLYCQQKQKQIQKLEASQQSQLSKLFLPLSNINHAYSINTSLYSESPPKTSHEIIQELEWLRKECSESEAHRKQMNRSLEYFKIENEHIKRELQLQKQINAEMKEEIEEMRQRMVGQRQKSNRSFTDLSRKHLAQSEQIKSLQAQIQELENVNATLVHNKETLQRSLKVSSEMILCLKQENDQLKNRSNLEEEENGVVSVSEVKKIVMVMMKEQLELEDKLKKSEEAQPKPIILNESLQKKYEQGYQSITRRSKIEHFKTENYSSGSKKGRNYTEISFIQEFNNKSSLYSQDSSQNRYDQMLS